jgi:hypothetical protein
MLSLSLILRFLKLLLIQDDTWDNADELVEKAYSHDDSNEVLNYQQADSYRISLGRCRDCGRISSSEHFGAHSCTGTV